MNRKEIDKENKNLGGVMLSVAPTDKKEKATWAHHMLRIQVAFWVDDGAKCAQCQIPYETVDDFLIRHPKRGYGKDFKGMFVDEGCWLEYRKTHKKPKEKKK